MLKKHEKGDSEVATGTATAPVAERLNFYVSPAVAAETRQLADDLEISMTQLFKYALSIFKIAVVEGSKNRKLVIADQNGTALREFILPELDSVRKKLVSRR